MAQPKVRQVSPKNFEITDSKAFIGQFTQSINAFTSKSFTVTYPTAAPEPELTLQLLPATAPVNLLTVPAGTGQPTGPNDQFLITVAEDTASLPDKTILTCNITENAGGTISADWELRARKPTPVGWKLAFSDLTVNTSVTCLASDPRAVLTAPATGFEQEDFELKADDPKGTAIEPTVFGALPASLAPHFKWIPSGSIAITAMPDCTDTDSIEFELPGVYHPTDVALSVRTTFGGTCPDNTAFLQNTSAPSNLTIASRPQHLVVVLDRSGSMGTADGVGGTTRYDNAVIATRLLTHLLAGLRAGVNAEDSIGIVTFTDPGAWHAEPRSTDVKTALGLTKLSDAGEAIKTLDFGAPAANTPLGDGLVAGLELLAGAGPVGNRRLTLIALTDGFQTGGTRYIGDTDPSGLPPGTVKSFFAPLGTQALDDVRTATRRLVIGLGAAVETDVLNALATPNFLPITDPSQLSAAFGALLQLAQEVHVLPTTDLGPEGPPVDPTKVFFTSATGADRVVFGVLTAVPNTAVTLERWDGTTFQPQTISVQSTATHHVGTVADVPAVASGPITWRVRLVDKTTNAAQTLTKANVLAFEDLHIKADVLLDADSYLTGDRMNLKVRIRHDSEPILGAKVRAELEAPEFGRGDALSDLGPDFHQKRFDGKDRPPLAEEMIHELMRRNKWSHWPHDPKPGLFIDGSDELHDFDGDGNYTNTFDRVRKEGAFKWTIFIEGHDTAGNFFNRQLSIATFAGVSVDRRGTIVRVVRIDRHPSGMRAARVIITPRDARHERLGPNKDDLIIFALRQGVFEHVLDHEPAPVFTDGSYQRVVLFRGGQQPRLEVSAAGTLLRPIDVAHAAVADRKSS